MYKYETKQLEEAAAMVTIWDKRMRSQVVVSKAAHTAYTVAHDAIWDNTPIAVAHDVCTPVWHNKGRYILLAVLLLLSCMYVKHTEGKIYHSKHHAWYTDQLSDVEFKAVKQQLWFY